LVEDEGSGERRCVTGDNMMMIMIIISPKTDTVSFYVKKDRRK